MGDPPELSLLDGFALSVGGEPQFGIPIGSQRLLGFLAVDARPATRAWVAGTLWPESTEARAAACLRSGLSRLDDRVRPALTVTAVHVGLAAGVHVDLHDARALADRLIDPYALSPAEDVGSLAVRALSADLLPGWGDDWAVATAAEWRQLRLHALEVVVARLTDAHRWAEADAAAQAAVRSDPLRETARAALIRVQIAEGRHSAAVEEFERYRRLIETEHGIAPTTRISQLVAGLPRR
jgi:DNA-binding SARP family transcriptional activator